MSSLYIKNFDPELHRALKIMALQERKLLSELVQDLLHDALLWPDASSSKHNLEKNKRRIT